MIMDHRQSFRTFLIVFPNITTRMTSFYLQVGHTISFKCLIYSRFIIRIPAYRMQHDLYRWNSVVQQPTNQLENEYTKLNRTEVRVEYS
jgi:hypothetical protein